MNKFIGAFAFQNMGNGCLAGKYFNNGTPRAYSECCVNTQQNITEPIDPFIGRFFSTWIEESESPESGFLTISARGEQGLYTLEWEGSFTGEGMLMNGILVGWYRN
jgi:hypothetical protein